MNNYFYIGADGQQYGPVPGMNLRSLGVTKDTPVWCEGMPTWEKAESVPELAAYFVVVPPYNPNPQPSTLEMCPSNHLVWAILVTIFCCMPFGVVAIVNSSKVEQLWSMGMRKEAIAKANSAKKWCWAGFICGGSVIVIYWLIYALIFIFAIVANSI